MQTGAEFEPFGAAGASGAVPPGSSKWVSLSFHPAFIIEDQDGRFHEGIKLQKDAEKVRQDLTAQRAEQEKLRREAEYLVKKSVIDEERLRRQARNRQN